MFALHLAFSFLTRLPISTLAPVVEEYDERDFEKSYIYFPVVGLVIGIFAWVFSLVLLSTGFHVAVVAFIQVAFLTLITGALHIDGLADTADGFFSGKPKEEILRIMKESNIGAFGVTAIILLLLGKYAAIFSLLEDGRAHAVIAALALSRWGMAVASYGASYPREEGTGKKFIGTVRYGDLWIATAAAFSIALIFSGLKAVLLIIIAYAVAWAVKAWAHRKIGGVTGDVLGATGELIELIVLVFL